MNQSNKKEAFKILIQEFQEFSLPEIIERELEVPLDSKKIVTIYGPRRSGKSFYFYSLVNKLLASGVTKDRILYISFEDDRILPLSSENMNDLIEGYFELYPDNKKNEIFLFFDEIQKIQDWEVFIRRIYDKEKAKIFITGSSSKLLSREIATALRGRSLSFPLYPLNFREFLKFKNESPDKNFEYTSARFKLKKLLDEYLEFGMFPEVVLTENINLKNNILKEYFDLLVYRDLVERFNIKNLDLLKDILKYLFTNIISLFSVNSYYKSVKQIMPASRETIYEYMSNIKETEYFYTLPRFSYSLKEQKVNLHKVIALDNGLRNRVSFKFSKDLGKLAENMVGSILARDNKDNLYYWQNKKEVDFVINNNGLLTAINVSIGSDIDKREIESLKEFKNSFTNVDKLTLLTLETEKEEDDIEFVPLYKWLLKEQI